MAQSSASSGGASSLSSSAFAAVGFQSDSSGARDVSTTSDSVQPSPAKPNAATGKFASIGEESRGGGSGPASVPGSSALLHSAGKDPKPGSSTGDVTEPPTSTQFRSRSLSGRTWARDPRTGGVSGSKALLHHSIGAAGSRFPTPELTSLPASEHDRRDRSPRWG